MGCVHSNSKVAQVRMSNKFHSTLVPAIQPLSFLKKIKGPLSSEYVEVRTLGSGAFAEVKLCIHVPTNEQRAVKFIHKSGLFLDQMDAEYQLREISILTSLDHPNILRCYAIYEDTNLFYVVTEYCEGGELFDKIIKWKKFSEEQASLIYYQLMSAVSYCHEKSIIHRDLKPENILLEEKGDSLNIKIADFGSSCFFDPKKKLQNLFGTAYYIAPEVLRGGYTEKCDLWSCGVILFVLLTGCAPYPGKDNPTILRNVRNSPLRIKPENHPNLSKEALDILQKLLIVDYSERISATEALLHPWVQNSRKFLKDSQNLTNTLKQLSSFTSNSKLKDAVYTFLAYQIITHEEIKALKKDFQVIDSNGDGKITRDELMEQYLKVMNEDEAIKTVDSIMREVDTNDNGDIDYSEFLKACMNHKKNLSRQNLEKIFAMFDSDGNGEISIEEIKSLLGDKNEINSAIWEEFIKEFDGNADGKIDFNEFIRTISS